MLMRPSPITCSRAAQRAAYSGLTPETPGGRAFQTDAMSGFIHTAVS